MNNLRKACSLALYIFNSHANKLRSFNTIELSSEEILYIYHNLDTHDIDILQNNNESSLQNIDLKKIIGYSKYGTEFIFMNHLRKRNNKYYVNIDLDRIHINADMCYFAFDSSREGFHHELEDTIVDVDWNILKSNFYISYLDLENEENKRELSDEELLTYKIIYFINRLHPTVSETIERLYIETIKQTIKSNN